MVTLPVKQVQCLESGLSDYSGVFRTKLTVTADITKTLADGKSLNSNEFRHLKSFTTKVMILLDSIPKNVCINFVNCTHM